MERNLKHTKREMLDRFKYELDAVKTQYSLLFNPHPNHYQAKLTIEERGKMINEEELKERIAFFKQLIQVVENFKYKEEN